MSTTKYLKFGARADKNLSDLSDPSAALDNILNDISAQVDSDGNPLGFTSSDLFPLIGLAETGLANNLTVSGQSSELLNLAGNTLRATSTSGTLIDVEPRVTIQDYITNFKTILGDPPWVDGGTGPDATFIPSDRLNANTTDNVGSIIACDPGDTQGGGAQDLTVGNRYRIEVLANINQNGWNDIAGTTNVTYAIGSIFTCAVTVSDAVGDGNHNAAACRNVTLPNGNSGTANANALTSNQLFTTKVDASLTSIVGPEEFWTNGKFNLSGKIHPSFTNTFGGIQWTGYLSGQWDIQVESTGFYIIEEDRVDDGSENNWSLLKAVTTETIKTFSEIKWTLSDQNTLIEFTDEDDYKRVCNGMDIVINDIRAEVTRVYRTSNGDGTFTYYAELDQDVGTEDTSGSIQTFEYDLFDERINSEIFYFTRTALSERRRVRISTYWPSLGQGLQYPSKLFSDIGGGESLGFQYFYKNDGSTDVYGKYSFPYFNENRANILKQESGAKLTVDDVLSLEYTPSQNTQDVITGYNTASDTVPADDVKLVEDGVLDDVLDGSTFSGSQKGDWIVAVPAFTTNWANAASKAYAFQIEYLPAGSKAYVSKNYGTLMGLALEQTHYLILVKNRGLIGIYKKDAPTATNECLLRKLDTGTGAMDKDTSLVSVGDLVHTVTFTGAAGSLPAHNYPLKVNSISSTSTQASVVVAVHPKDSADMISGDGIAIVYASRGLNDISAKSECEGAYGLEVNVASPIATPQKIYVSDISRGADMVNDVAYYVGSNSASPVIDQSSNNSSTNATLVTGSGTDATGTYITLDRNITAPIETGTTVVLMSDTNAGRYKNREYCIIPLNTAPPWTSTSEGLATPSGNPDLITEGLIFRELGADVATSNVVSLATNPFSDPNSVSDKYVPITFNGNTYKILVNDNTLT